MYGQSLQVKQLEGNGAVEFDLSDLSAGIYFIIVEDGDQRIVEKVVKN